MSESLILALLQRADAWARAAGTNIKSRAHWSPASFVAQRRPEERALLAAAAEVYDLVSATPEGRAVLEAMGCDPDAGGLPSSNLLLQRMAEWQGALAPAKAAPVAVGGAL